MQKLIKQLFKSQSSFSGFAIFVLILLAARANGVDLLGLTGQATELMTAVGLLAAAAKVVFPDSPAPPSPQPEVKS
jgi:hypothetical protein